MKILNLLASGGTGGIEILCKNIILYSNEDHRICCLFAEGEIYKQLEENGKKVFSTIKFKKNIFKIVKQIEKYCQEQKIDVIIVHHGGMSCNIIYLLLMKKLKNVKFVRYLHGCFDEYSFGNDGNRFKKFLIKIIMEKALKKSDLIVYISEAVKRSFEKVFNIKDKNSKVIYNGIPNSFFEKKIDKKYNNNLEVSYIGRLAKAKGVNLLIEAVSKINIKDINAIINVIGNGKIEKELKDEVQKLKLAKYIHFSGRIDNVIPILDKTDIFIYPSIWEEGFGISVVEAMARGCIPITFRKGGLPEIIENNRNGILVDEVSSVALAKAIMEVILMCDEKKKMMSEEAIKRAKKFSLDNTINNIENSLKSIL